ncbi:MAG TPA: FixH family protein [Dissulfurispiraceae bacterium]
MSLSIKTTAVIAMVLLLIAGIAFAKDYEVTKKAGEYDVVVKMDKNPPVVGDNNVKVALKDASGKAVTDAKVSIDYGMPAMPGMPAMNYKTDTEFKGGEYAAKMDLSMSGSWNIAVKIAKSGKTSTAKFSVDAK